MSTSVPFSIRIDSQTKKMLEEVAENDNLSASALTIDLIKKYLEARKNKHLAIKEALIEADEGEFISHEKMRTWFASLGTKNEQVFPEVDVFVE